MISLYIHIPFCVKKCLYCDFLSFPCVSDEYKEKYVVALCNEIELTEVEDRLVGSIFFGGGTPSVLDVRQIERIVQTISKKFVFSDDLELSLECNPGTVTPEKLIQLYRIGINRLSIGVQSTQDDELELLGRIHIYSDFVNTFTWAREAGFKNINVDIMSALPGQTRNKYIKTLTDVVRMNPEHVSAYSLIIEENTVFNDVYGIDKNVSDVSNERILAKLKETPLPDEELEREMYYMTEEILEKAGYQRYEISNYAKEGYECRHNRVYWTGGDYISFGLGASSYVKGKRYNNISDMDEYIYLWSDGAKPQDEKVYTDVNILSKKEMMEEYMFVGLRLIKGVKISEFKNRFGLSMEEIYREPLSRLEKEGLIVVENDTIRLSRRGIDVSNRVLCEFLLD